MAGCIAHAHGISRAQWMILVRLRRHDGLTQRELAELLEVEPITVGRLMDRPAARNLIEHRADPSDRRCWRLHLRPEAAPVLAEIDQAKAAFDAATTRDLPEDQRAAIRDALLLMKSNLLAGE